MITLDQSEASIQFKGSNGAFTFLTSRITLNNAGNTEFRILVANILVPHSFTAQISHFRVEYQGAAPPPLTPLTTQI